MKSRSLIAQFGAIITGLIVLNISSSNFAYLVGSIFIASSFIICGCAPEEK